MNIGTCVSHCCKEHGCKYGHEDCPVMAGTHQQECPCESCPPWSLKWPTTPGLYWFFGVRGMFHQTPQLWLVRGFKSADPKGLTFSCEGAFLYPEEARGRFLPVEEPDLPVMPLPPKKAT